MSKEVEAWKVFKLSDGKLYPAVVEERHEGFHTQKENYPQKGWGPFASFKNMEPAKRFMQSCYGRVGILKVKGVKSKKRLLRSPHLLYITGRFSKTFSPFSCWPDTILLDSFKIIDE